MEVKLHRIPILSLFKLFFLFIPAFYFQSADAQKPAIDSILLALRQHPQEDTTRVQLLSDLAYNYHTISPDSTTLLAKQAYELAEKLHYEKGLADALKHWAIGSYIMSQYDNAIEYNEKALAIYEKLGEKKGSGAILNNIAIIRHNQGDFQTALNYYNRSLEIRIEVDDKRGIGASYNNIGNTYSDMGSYAEALYNLFRGLQIRERLNDKQAVANSLANIANIYFLLGKYNESLNYSFKAISTLEGLGSKDGSIQTYVAIGGVYHVQKKHDKALEYFGKALKLSEEMGSKHSIALCLSNIGEEFVSQHKYKEAEKYYENAMTLVKESGDLPSVAINHIGLGIVNLKTSRIQKSVEHFLLSYQIATEIGSRLHILESAQYLGDAYEKLGDLKNSNFYLRKYVAYKDSIFNDELAKRSQQLEFDFLLDKKQKEIALLEKDRSIQQEINNRSRVITFSLAILIIISFIFIWILYQSRQKVSKVNTVTLHQKEEIERQAKELVELNILKDKLLSIMSHDLRSPLASLTGILSLLDQDMISPEEFVMLKNGMNKQLSSVSLLLDNLLHWSRSQLQGEGSMQKEIVQMDEIIERNIALLQEAAKRKDILLIYNNTQSYTAYADPNHVDIVIRNLISNSIKFTNRSGSIQLNVEIAQPELKVSVIDNGIGMSEEVCKQIFERLHTSSSGTDGEKGTGLGLLLCKDFVHQNNGTIGVTSKQGEGSTFYFTLPTQPNI
jgi:signal transduction histidine kinase